MAQWHVWVLWIAIQRQSRLLLHWGFVSTWHGVPLYADNQCLRAIRKYVKQKKSSPEQPSQKKWLCALCVTLCVAIATLTVFLTQGHTKVFLNNFKESNPAATCIKVTLKIHFSDG